MRCPRGERDDGGVFGTLERVEPAQDVGRLAKRQAEVGPVERDVAEPDQRAAGRLLLAQPAVVRRNPRQRHARLHAALHLDERDLHVDRRGQFRLIGLDLFQLDDFAGSARGGRAGRSITVD